MASIETIINLQEYNSPEYFDDFAIYFLCTKRNDLPDFDCKYTEWLFTEYSTADHILSHYLGRKPTENDYSQLQIISLSDDEQINYYVQYGDEILGGLVREEKGNEYSLQF